MRPRRYWDPRAKGHCNFRSTRWGPHRHSYPDFLFLELTRQPSVNEMIFATFFLIKWAYLFLSGPGRYSCFDSVLTLHARVVERPPPHRPTRITPSPGHLPITCHQLLPSLSWLASPDHALPGETGPAGGGSRAPATLDAHRCCSRTKHRVPSLDAICHHFDGFRSQVNHDEVTERTVMHFYLFRSQMTYKPYHETTRESQTVATAQVTDSPVRLQLGITTSEV